MSRVRLGPVLQGKACLGMARPDEVRWSPVECGDAGLGGV